MAKGRSGGGRSSSPAPTRTQTRSYSSTPAAAPARTTPAPAAQQPHHAPQQQQHAQPPMQQQQQGGGGMLSGLAGTVMSGMAFGTGSAIAHRAVDSIAGPREVNHVHTNESAAAASSSSSSQFQRGCVDQNNKFTMCMKENQGSIASCQYLFDVLSQCQRETSNQ